MAAVGKVAVDKAVAGKIVSLDMVNIQEVVRSTTG